MPIPCGTTIDSALPLGPRSEHYWTPLCPRSIGCCYLTHSHPYFVPDLGCGAATSTKGAGDARLMGVNVRGPHYPIKKSEDVTLATKEPVSPSSPRGLNRPRPWCNINRSEDLPTVHTSITMFAQRNVSKMMSRVVEGCGGSNRHPCCLQRGLGLPWRCVSSL